LRTLRDAELASLAAIGDRAAFGELLRRYAPGTRMMLRRMGAMPALAEDLAQDACLKAFERIATYRGDGSFGGWLNRIAARLYIRKWRHESRIDWLPELPDDISGDIAPIALVADSMDLDKALRALNPAERVCVSLCVGVGMTHQEVAIELRLPLGTVKSHVHRGLVKLRAHFDPRESVDGATQTQKPEDERVRA
jgi:RNA polymerase sigma-70 factor (ECF subfamily)